MISQQINENLKVTADELRKQLQNANDAIPWAIINPGRNLLNTDPYWKAKQQENETLNDVL